MSNTTSTTSKSAPVAEIQAPTPRMIPAGMEEAPWPEHGASFPEGDWLDEDIEAFDEPDQGHRQDMNDSGTSAENKKQ